MYGGRRPLVAASGRFSPQHVQGLKFIESTHPVAASGCFSRVAACVRWPQVAAFVERRKWPFLSGGRKWPLFPFSISTPKATPLESSLLFARALNIFKHDFVGFLGFDPRPYGTEARTQDRRGVYFKPQPCIIPKPEIPDKERPHLWMELNRSSHITMSYHPEWYWIKCKNMTSLRTWDTWALHLGLESKLRSMIEAWKKHWIWEELGTNHANPGLSDAVERANLEIAADMGGFDDSYLVAQRMPSLGCSCRLSFP